MATATPPARRRSLLWVLVAIGLVIAVAVVGLLVAVLVRQPATPTAAATPTPTPQVTATPTPGTSGSGEPSGSQTQQHQQYRAYVSAVVQSGTAVVADMLGLAGCRNGRQECVARINDASNQVASMQKNLAENPAPPCLSDADARLQDSLTFQQKGLDTARNAVVAQNRIRFIQGLLLTAAGLWRGGQAIADGRHADC